MATAKSLQVPVILSIQGSTIRIKHPDLSEYIKTSLVAPFTAAGTTLTVRDNQGFADDDWMIIGRPENAKTEEVDVNGTVTRGTSLTITNSTKFSHEIDTPVTKIFERAIKIYGASTDGGSGTLIASIDAITTPIADAINIRWDKPFTEYTLITTDTAYAYYFVKFTDGTTDSNASDYVPSSGLAYNTGRAIVEAGLELVRAEVDGSLITWEFLLRRVNDFKNEVANFVLPDGTPKNWPWEIIENVSSISTTQNAESYAVSSLSIPLKYPDSIQGIIQVKLGADILSPIDLDEMEKVYDGIAQTTIATQASAAATSVTLTDVSEFSDSGSCYLGTDLITYTARNTLTNVLSGIPASGTGSITETQAAGLKVWQGIKPDAPTKFTLFNNNIILNAPVDENTAGKKLKVKYYGAVVRVDSLADILDIPFTHLGKIYIGSQIEYRKKNNLEGDRLRAEFETKLLAEANRNMAQMEESVPYYTIPKW